MASAYYNHDKSVKGTEFAPAEAVILADSLAKHLNYVTRTNVHYYSGCSIDKLTSIVQNQSNHLELDKYKCITVLIGTNNLTPKWVWSDYIKQKRQFGDEVKLAEHTTTPSHIIIDLFHHLLTTIRSKNATCSIIVCAIPPRPFDHSINKVYLTSVNKELEKLCNRFDHCSFIKLYKSFTHQGAPILKLYEDGLHLSADGNILLKRILNTFIGTALKKYQQK